MTALFLVLLLLCSSLVNGLFVAAEFALVRTRSGRIEALAKEGESGAEEALEQLDKIDESLAACQVGITMASIGIGFLGEPAIASLIEPVLGDGTGVAVTASRGDRVRDRHLAPHHDRRAGPEDARDHPRRRRRPARSRDR